MEVNDKIIQRAIAQSLVHDAPDLIKLVKEYYPLEGEISKLDLLLIVQHLLESNNQFAVEYTEFLIKRGWLVDYNNAIGIGAAVSGAIQGVSNVISSVVNAGSSKQQAQAAARMSYSESTQQLMQFMMQEEQAKIEKERQKNNIVYIAMGSMVLLVGILIFAKKM